MNKKKLCALTALALTAALTLCACGKKEEQPEPTPGQSASQAAPSEQAAARQLSLKEADLSVTTWSSPNGATVNLTAVPDAHDKGDSAEFVVRLDGEEVTSVSCEWKDGAFVASADLNGADGYCYYVQLSGSDGAFAEIPVNTTAEPVNEALVNMASALSAYCSLTLEDAALEDGNLTVLNGYALVQAPRITVNDENVACAKATLVLLLDGEEIASVELTMAPGEADRSYDASITDLSLAVPADIREGQQLDLRLDAVLTNGQAVTAEGGSWQYTGSGITNTVG